MLDQNMLAAFILVLKLLYESHCRHCPDELRLDLKYTWLQKVKAGASVLAFSFKTPWILDLETVCKQVHSKFRDNVEVVDFWAAETVP